MVDKIPDGTTRARVIDKLEVPGYPLKVKMMFEDGPKAEMGGIVVVCTAEEFEGFEVGKTYTLVIEKEGKGEEGF
jgi:hypothetical protein